MKTIKTKKPSPKSVLRSYTSFIQKPLNQVLPKPHRKILSDFLTKPKSFRSAIIFGGRGALKTSLLNVLALLTVLHDDGDVLVICRSKICQQAFVDNLTWLVSNAIFPGVQNQPLKYQYHEDCFTCSTTGRKIRFKISNCLDKTLRGIDRKNIALLIVDDAETIRRHDLHTIASAFPSKSVRRVISAIPQVKDLLAYDQSLKYDLLQFFPGRFFRLDYRSVPVKWLGYPFFREAAELKSIAPDAYRAYYLALPPLKKKGNPKNTLRYSGCSHPAI